MFGTLSFITVPLSGIPGILQLMCFYLLLYMRTCICRKDLKGYLLSITFRCHILPFLLCALYLINK